MKKLQKRVCSFLATAVVSISSIYGGMTIEVRADESQNWAAGITDTEQVAEKRAIWMDSSRDVEERVDALLSCMTLEEKAAQMVQPEQDESQGGASPSDVAYYSIGSVLSAGGSAPSTGNGAEDWQNRINQYKEAALQSRLGIPLIYGVDAVHGHNNVDDAVMFPQTIGLGATNDEDLVRRVGQASAEEIRATGIQWTFAPVLGIPWSERWGRFFECFGEDPELVSRLGAAYIEGLQGTEDDYFSTRAVAASAKHYIGEGQTVDGINTGNVDVSVEEFDRMLLEDGIIEPYRAAFESGARTVMCSLDSVSGQLTHGNYHLLTEILKGEKTDSNPLGLGFTGFVVTDYTGIHHLPYATHKEKVVAGVNAGLDMFMEPFDWVEFMNNLIASYYDNSISAERIDDAVRRILRVKFEMGLFEEVVASETEQELMAKFGGEEHRAIAREAVAKSATVLKNDKVGDTGKTVLQLLEQADNITIAGPKGNDMGAQCGGWTVTWQGMLDSQNGGKVTAGTTIYEGFQEVVDDGVTVNYSASGNITSDSDIAIVVVGEDPYAETAGDRTPETLALPASDLEVIRTAVDSAGDTPLVLLLMTGRPLAITDFVADFDAVVEAWLPGSEGAGIADVMMKEDMDFTAVLPVTWTWYMEDIEDKFTDPAKVLFPYGTGLKKDGTSINAELERPELQSVTIDGKIMTTFDPWKQEQKIFVRNLEDLPTVEVTVSEGMKCELIQATAETQSAVAVVTNGSITNTYTFIFTNEADLEPIGENPVYASATKISVNGERIYNFYPEEKSYSVNVEDIAGAEITAETPEGVDAVITKYDGYAVVRAESDDHATEYRIDLVTAPKNDDFSGDTLNTDIWMLNNPDESHYRMTEDGFEITSQIGQYYGTNADNYVMNYLSQPADGDWEAVVVLNHAVPGGQVYQQFGVAVMQDENNFVGVKYECNDWNDGAWEGLTNVVEINGSSSSDVLNQSIISSFVNSGNTHDIYYKIRKIGNEYQLSVSTDGVNYADMGTKTVELNDEKLVIFACNGMGINRYGNTITPSEIPVLVKDVQVTDLTSYEQPEITTVTIDASEDGAITKLKGTSSFYQYGSGIVREASEDSEDPEGSAGEIFGWIAPGYYLLFDVNVEKSGYYTVAPRAAALDESGTVQYIYQLESDGELLCSFEHGATGGWKEWVTQGAKKIYLTEGNHTFRLLYNSDSINVNYLEFTYTPEEQPADLPYTDVNKSDWFYDSVRWAYEKGVAAGTTPTLFTPDGKCTRAEIVTFLWRAAGSPEPATDTCTFSDVQSNAYYYNAVLWAVEKGITYGETNTRFAPDKQCTRAEIVTFLWRSAGSPDSTLNECQFTDVQTNEYYYEAVLWAVENKITSGQTAVLFGTDAVCTRAEAVVFIYRSSN